MKLGLGFAGGSLALENNGGEVWEERGKSGEGSVKRWAAGWSEAGTKTLWIGCMDRGGGRCSRATE